MLIRTLGLPTFCISFFNFVLILSGFALLWKNYIFTFTPWNMPWIFDLSKVFFKKRSVKKIANQKNKNMINYWTSKRDHISAKSFKNLPVLLYRWVLIYIMILKVICKIFHSVKSYLDFWNRCFLFSFFSIYILNIILQYTVTTWVLKDVIIPLKKEKLQLRNYFTWTLLVYFNTRLQVES